VFNNPLVFSVFLRQAFRMDTRRIFEIQSPEQFEAIALETFVYQYQNVPVYREFCDYLGKNPTVIAQVADIPFLPIVFFKTHQVLSKGHQAEIIFQSSGTTGSIRSKHFVADLSLYRESFNRGFQHFYGAAHTYCILALLPSYQERSDASLSYMVWKLIGRSSHPKSGFYEPSQLQRLLTELSGTNTPVLLIGVTFALLDLVESLKGPLKNVTVIETGGMKGRRKEMVREELHQVLCEGFGIDKVHSEYGMTELLSQAYSYGDGLFYCPTWMQIRIRDTEDPLTSLEAGRTGGVNIIDLANRYSCAFIATQDLGKAHANGSFEILGRFDHADIRGCNLMAL
jgi:phenylacetate-coenzyme A ligase PaaK-like adenylate-forming protein